ncbi:MAG: AtpZ/AtpI family protein [Planctomycetota bacterium]|jgi:ATP synthase protein I
MNERGRHVVQMVARRQRRAARAAARRQHELWYGFGMFGIIGWAVCVPMVVLVFAGVYLDRQHPASFSWTVTGLVAGLALGCANAWWWVSRQRRRIEGEAQALHTDEEDAT